MSASVRVERQEEGAAVPDELALQRRIAEIGAQVVVVRALAAHGDEVERGSVDGDRHTADLVLRGDPRELALRDRADLLAGPAGEPPEEVVDRLVRGGHDDQPLVATRELLRGFRVVGLAERPSPGDEAQREERERRDDEEPRSDSLATARAELERVLAY